MDGRRDMTLTNITTVHSIDQSHFSNEHFSNDNEWDADFQFFDGKRFDNGDSALENRWAQLVSSNIERSAEQGSSFAQSCISHMYLSGFGVAKNPKKAFHWCSVAAEQNDIDALFELGMMYLQGIGIKKCQVTAKKLFELAARRDHALSLFKLAEMLHESQDDEQSSLKAFYACQKAANLGLEEAQFNLGVMFEDGLGTDQNFKKAAFWYGKAAKKGNKRALNNLGNMHLNGKGVVDDHHKAQFLFTLAAEAGSILARFNLGVIGGFNIDKKPANLYLSKRYLTIYFDSLKNLNSSIRSVLIQFFSKRNIRISQVGDCFSDRRKSHKPWTRPNG